MGASTILRVLPSLVMPPPTTEMWLQQAQLFREKWQFPHCISAIDGKHVTPPEFQLDVPQLQTYKINQSILMAIVDAEYRFVCVDIGTYGKNSDGGIFERLEMRTRFATDQMNVPAATTLPGTDVVAPFTLVGDETFAMSDFMLRPYPRSSADPDGSKRALNYRLSRAHRRVENGFVILAQIWRIYMRPIELAPKKVNVIVMATILLHNFLTPSTFNYDPSIPSALTKLGRPLRQYHRY